jgi:hypothetical protein
VLSLVLCFQNVRLLYFQLDKAIESAEREYSNADIPMEPTKANLLLREHEASRSKIKNLVDFTAEEGEEIAVRVRQQVRDEQVQPLHQPAASRYDYTLALCASEIL